MKSLEMMWNFALSEIIENMGRENEKVHNRIPNILTKLMI